MDIKSNKILRVFHVAYHLIIVRVCNTRLIKNYHAILYIILYKLLYKFIEIATGEYKITSIPVLN